MKLAHRIVARIMVAGLILGTPSAVFARNGNGNGGNSDGPSQGEIRTALLGLINAATGALNSGACTGEHQIPELPE